MHSSNSKELSEKLSPRKERKVVQLMNRLLVRHPLFVRYPPPFG